MHVSLIGNWPRPYGGVAVHVAALARALRARGADVVVLDIGRGDHRGPGLRPARGTLRYALALSAVAAERRLVHLHTSGANPKSWLVALSAGRARRAGAPRGVLTLHSGSAPAFLRRSAGHRALAAAACAGFGAVVAVNAEIAEALAAAGVERDRVHVLPAFSGDVLEPPEDPPGLASFRARHAPLVSAALAPGPIYGAELLVHSFRRLRRERPGAGLVVFGAGTDGRAWNGPGTLGLGEVAHRAALGVLAASDVFVRPTRVDGDAITVREALALGCAVVASDVGHRPAGCLLFPTGDVEALSARLSEAAAGRRAIPRGAPGGFEALFEIYERLSRGAAPLPAAAPRSKAGRGTAP